MPLGELLALVRTRGIRLSNADDGYFSCSRASIYMAVPAIGGVNRRGIMVRTSGRVANAHAGCII